ncbi:hypothetical protein [Terrisporobacter sp.]|uniref:hypothetical protein n=1 Tax=Terrisporobacter sp. TaxID=1965305 RepID=UPI00261B1AC6|nr:hypothetical protein [Terrisporobacter sp.]
MKKNILIFVLIFSSLIFYGCSKNKIDNNLVSLSTIDISALNNKNILNIVNDENLEEGVYKIITKENKYIFFNGIKNEFKDVNSYLEDKTFIIKSNTISSSESNKKLYVIRKKNTIYSEDENVLYDSISIFINEKKSSFSNVYIIE